MPVTIPAQEIKRRGMSVLNEKLASGPVWVISNNKPKYVVLFADDFRRMRHEAFVDECVRSDAEYRAGLAKPTTVDDLMSVFDE
jgi:PHD/YefM family antitoxin component YafN of YafNO toxin-antitoxin module